MFDLRLVLAVPLLIALGAPGVKAHEFWIDPVDFVVPPGAPIVADIRVGEEFRGSSYSYLPRNFRRFDIAQGNVLTPVDGRLGDRPALTQNASNGLAVIVHVTTDNRLDYVDFAKFEAFVDHKDARWTLEAHDARGLSRDKFGEVYSRYAKSLVAVGQGAGADQAYGLEIEMVALANPYTDDLSAGLPVQLFYQGNPRPDAQIEIFEEAPDGTVSVTLTRTDAHGKARVPVRAGHRYLVDSVLLREPSDALAEEKNAVWESLWASLTFGVPED